MICCFEQILWKEFFQLWCQKYRILDNVFDCDLTFPVVGLFYYILSMTGF